MLPACIADPGREKSNRRDERKREKAPHISPFFEGSRPLLFSPLVFVLRIYRARIYRPFTDPAKAASTSSRCGRSRQILDRVLHEPSQERRHTGDNIEPDGTIDQSEWSYNQGSVMDAYRLLYLATGNPADLARAESLADATLAAFSGHWLSEPPEFAAIFFRRLLDLAALDGRTNYVAAAQRYANKLWGRRYHSLLEQAAVVQLYAALASAQLPRQHFRPQ